MKCTYALNFKLIAVFETTLGGKKIRQSMDG